jgi:uncharacterized protein YjdB
VAEAVPLTGISLDKTILTMTKGGTEKIAVTYTPANTTQSGVSWATSDPAVATVSNGTIRAVGGGSAVITVTSTANPSKIVACAVSVPVPLEEINLPSTLTIVETLRDSLAVTYTPADTTQKGVTWSSDTPSVAAVDPNTGLVTAVAVGTATITATSTVHPSKTAFCTVTVVEPRHGISVSFTGFEDETIELDPVKQGDWLNVSAPAGFDRYLWYVDGSPYSGIPTSTLSTSISTPGLHYITVIVEKSDGFHFSKTVKYTVGY